MVKVGTGGINYLCDIIVARSDQVKVAKLPQVKGAGLLKPFKREVGILIGVVEVTQL